MKKTIRVFKCLENTIGAKGHPVKGQIYSEDYTWGAKVFTIGEQVDTNCMGGYKFKLLGTIEVDCSPPTVDERQLPKKRRFKLITGDGWCGFVEGVVYDEDYEANCQTVIYHATKGRFQEDWQEVFEEEDNVTLPIYPDPIYISYSDVERDKWYDVREVLPDESFDRRGLIVKDGITCWTAKWDEEFGGFLYGDCITHWKL